MKKLSTLNAFAYGTAVALAGFSGAVATYGLTKLAPGGELVIAGMGILFEAGKLTSFALLHRSAIPRTLRCALAGVGTVLMVANVAGVSGFLSAAYEHSRIAAQAAAHTSEATARASASLIERQLAASESNLAAARTAVIKARDDRGRQKAAQAVVATATAERDGLLRQLGSAQQISARVEGEAISAGGELAAVTFIAAATGTSPDAVARGAILTISALPDILAVLLLVAAGYKAPKPARAVRARKSARRPVRRAATKVIAQHAKAA